MKTGTLIRWSARTITLLFAAFITIFSFDVFEEHAGFWKLAAALLIHNLPSIALLLIVWISWRREWIAGVVFTLLGSAYLYWAWGRFQLSVYFVIAGPLFVASTLYLLSYRIHKKEHSAQA